MSDYSVTVENSTDLILQVLPAPPPLEVTVAGATVTNIDVQLPGTQGPKGDTGAIGADGLSIRTANGAPSNLLGVDGDSYVDALNGNLYQKDSGAYVLVGNLTGPQGPQGIQGIQGPTGPTGSFADSFETVSKNLRSYPAALTYTLGQLTSIVYDLGGGDSITKTFGYSGGKLVTITLSGDTPSGIDLVKTFSYTGDNLTGVTYS